MATMSATERAALCDTALEVGEDQPTLAGEWTVKDLVAHLLLREGNPAVLTARVPGLSWVNDEALRRLSRDSFGAMVERLRTGPPRFSPFSLPKADAVLNTIEYFVHHEDIRRAQPAWTARALPAAHQDLLWRMVRVAGRGLVRKSAVGVVIERSDTGARAVLKRGEPGVVVRGLPAEATLFVYGRKPQAQVELAGTDADVALLQGTALGL